VTATIDSCKNSSSRHGRGSGSTRWKKERIDGRLGPTVGTSSSCAVVVKRKQVTSSRGERRESEREGPRNGPGFGKKKGGKAKKSDGCEAKKDGGSFKNGVLLLLLQKVKRVRCNKERKESQNVACRVPKKGGRIAPPPVQRSSSNTSSWWSSLSSWPSSSSSTLLADRSVSSSPWRRGNSKLAPSAAVMATGRRLRGG
jgi:hypothetical protein